MLSDYRNEKWSTVFTQVLLKTLRSAFLSSSVPDFIVCSLEALSLNIVMEQSERILVLENLWKVFQVKLLSYHVLILFSHTNTHTYKQSSK